MPFDPTLPADHSPLVAAQMRSQFIALAQLTTDSATNAANQLASQISGTSNNCNSVTTLGLNVGNPPQQWEVQAIANKLDELINALRR